MQPETGAVTILIHRFEQVESGTGEIFYGGYLIDDDGLVVRETGQKISDHDIFFVDKKRMIPHMRQMLIGECFHIRKIHQHAIV